VSYGRRFESVVKPCWAENPAARPDFSAICANVEQFLRPPTSDVYYVAGQSNNRESNGDLYDEAY